MVVVVEMGNHSVIVHQGGHELEVWLLRDIGMISPVGAVCIVVWGIGWWFALTNKICLIRKHLAYCWNGRTLLSHMLS